jgi:hypothetical protein
MGGFDLEKAMASKRRPQIAETPIKSMVIESIRRRQKTRFVKVPLLWMERLAHARQARTFKVALQLLYRHWKAGGGKPVVLPNAGLIGVRRGTKWRGLVELEKLGLIAIQRRSRKSPLITVFDSPGE